MKKLLCIMLVISASFCNLKPMEFSEKKEIQEKPNKSLALSKKNNPYAHLLNKIDSSQLPFLAELIIDRILMTFLAAAEQTGKAFGIDSSEQYSNRFASIRASINSSLQAVESSIPALDFLNYFDKKCEKTTQFNYSLISLYLNQRHYSMNKIIAAGIKSTDLYIKQILFNNETSERTNQEKEEFLQKYKGKTFDYNKNILYERPKNLSDGLQLVYKLAIKTKALTIEKTNFTLDDIKNLNEIINTCNKLKKNIDNIEKISEWLTEAKEQFLTNRSSLKLLNEFHLALCAISDKMQDSENINRQKNKEMREEVADFINFLQSLQTLLKSNSPTTLNKAINYLNSFAHKVANILKLPSVKDFPQIDPQSKSSLEKKIKQAAPLLKKLKKSTISNQLHSLLTFLKNTGGMISIETLELPNLDDLTIEKEIPALHLLIAKQILSKKDNKNSQTALSWNGIFFAPLYLKILSTLENHMIKLESKNRFKKTLKKNNNKQPNKLVSNQEIITQEPLAEEKISEKNKEKESSEDLMEDTNEPNIYSKNEIREMIEFNQTTHVETDQFLILFRSWSSDPHGQATLVIRKPKKALSLGNFSVNKAQSPQKQDMFHKVISSVINKTWLQQYGRSFTFDSSNYPKKTVNKYGIKPQKLKNGDLILYYSGFMFTGREAKEHFLALKNIGLKKNNTAKDSEITSFINNLTHAHGKHTGAGICGIRKDQKTQAPFVFHSCFHKKLPEKTIVFKP